MLIKKTRIPVLHIITIGILPSFLKKIIYKLRGYKIAKNVSLSLGCVIIGKNVEIGQGTTIGFFTIVRASTIKIGRFVKIGAMSVVDTELFTIDDDARINEQVYIGGMKNPESALIMGKRTIIMQASYINPTKPIVIGDDSGIGGHCLLFTHGSWNSALDGYPVKFAPITIGKNVWLPWRVFVMPGVTIGNGAVIGADSLIVKDVPENSLAAGSPAKILKENFPTPLIDIEKKAILNDIIIDFKNYLQHNNFTVETKTNSSGFELLITNKNTTVNVVVLDAVDANFLPKTNSNSVVVLVNNKIENSSNNTMTISLEHKQRLGSTKVGEELVTFFSRYGIRFNRLD